MKSASYAGLWPQRAPGPQMAGRREGEDARQGLRLLRAGLASKPLAQSVGRAVPGSSGVLVIGANRAAAITGRQGREQQRSEVLAYVAYLAPRHAQRCAGRCPQAAISGTPSRKLQLPVSRALQ
jgi:hypothetical protein